MKKLSFGFGIALICILIFSCEDKSIVNPQNDEFKITHISSKSGYEGSAITLYGKNLKSSSLAAIKIGGYKAKIITLTDDSLVVIVPSLSFGSYQFEALSKANKIMFLTDFDINLNHDFKINNISSTTGYVNSLVVLYGENLDNSSIMSVKFGDQQAEILAKTKDSIIVKVPKLTNGLYDINIKTILKSFVYPQKYKVIQIDFSLFKNYKVSISGLNLKFNSHRVMDDMDHMETNTAYTIQSYCKTFTNSLPLMFIKGGNDSCKFFERSSENGYETKNLISFQFDSLNKKIITLSTDFYNSSSSSGTYTSSSSCSNFDFNLNDIDYTISNNNSILIIKLNKNDILGKMKNFDTGWFSSSNEWQYHSIYDSTDDTLVEILGINDDASLEIKFTK